jgi:hypothetical protein
MHNIDTIKETSISSYASQTKLAENISDFLGKYGISGNRGKFGEQNLCHILNTMYPTAEIRDTTGLKSSGDFIMSRVDKPVIMFENKEYKNNIDKEEVAKFIYDIDTQNTNGIFLSHFSGITFKKNYQIDIHKGNVLVYIQNCEYSVDKIRIAVDIIDNLSSKIQDLYIENDNNTISREVLDEINAEYQKYISQKESLILTVKDFNKKMIAQIEEISLPALDRYLEPKYAFVKNKGISYSCEI